MTKKKPRKGRMTIEIWPVDMDQYDGIATRINTIAWAKGLNYHTKFEPRKVKI